MSLIQSSDVDAFEELYDRYCSRAYRVARSTCRERGRAEEAVQEAFISIWRRPTTYHAERGAVATWLLTVVHNRAIDVARRNRAHDDRRVDANVIELHRAPVDLLAQAEARDAAGHLRVLLDELPAAQRQVIVLAFYGDRAAARTTYRNGEGSHATGVAEAPCAR
jgi:RNA polymerase sigma-70 factor (ECF subfamily)